MSLDAKITPLEQLNPNIKRVKVHIAYPDKNKKKFNIPKSTFEKMKNTLLGSPIVLHYFEDVDEIGGHEGDKARIAGRMRITGKTHAYGLVAYDVEPWYETIVEDDGTESEYITSIGYVWDKRFPEEAKHIYDAKQSMEIVIYDGFMSPEGYYNIEDGSFLALCALNKKSVTPTFEKSQFIEFSSDELSSELKSLKDELDQFVEKYSVASNKNRSKMSIDWLVELIEEISEIYGYDCTDDDAQDLYKEFAEYYEKEFSIPKKYKHIDFKPPIALARQAQKGLDLRAKQPDSNKCCTPVGIARARQLINRENLSPSTVRRMKSFFERHEVDKKGEGWGKDSKGYQAWLIWGNDVGYRWAKRIVAQMDKADEEAKMSNHMEDEEMTFSENVKVSTNPDMKIEGTVGEKDVAGIKRKVLDASNRNEIIPKIFAKYPEDLSGDITQAELGYPLMSERDGAFYYNTGFIKAASSRIEQQKDQPYYEKVRSNIVKARKKVGMPEEFAMEGGNPMDMKEMMAMMEKMAMDMYTKHGMRYMLYGMDGEYMYAMDTEKDMAKMMIPYAMMEDGSYAMDMEKMMAMDYEEKEMAIKTAMGMLAQKLAEMKKSEMAMMEKYSEQEADLNETKAKLAEYTTLEKNYDEEKAKAFEEFTFMKKSIEQKDNEIIKLKDLNEKFSIQLKEMEEEKKAIEVDKILNKAEFSMFNEDEIKDLKDLSKSIEVDVFEEKVRAKAFSKYIATESFSLPEGSGLNRMGILFNNDSNDGQDEETHVFSKLDNE